MNFHKTIGFLASLLLVLGLGVPDSFAQDVMDVKLSRTSVPERTNSDTVRVTVTVTLDEAPEEGTTVTITLTDNDADVAGVNVDVNHDVDGTLTAGYEAIEIAAPNKSGSSELKLVVTEDGDDDTMDSYIHPREKEVTITATPSGGGDAGTAMLTVRDKERPTGSLSLSSVPAALSVDGTGAATLTVSLSKAPGQTGTPAEDVTVTVNFATEHSVENAVAGSAGATTIAGSATSSTADLTGVAVTEAGSVMVTASADNYISATLKIEIIDRSADDIQGFRVTIATPAADGAWVGYGPNKVKVHVTRLNAAAYSWRTFESVAVALRDTHTVSGLGADATLGNIVTLTASGFGIVDDELIFTTAALLGEEAIAEDPDPDKVYKDKSITYEEANDRLIFSFALPNLSNDTPADSLGTLSDPSSARANDTDAGRRMSVFARATFTAEGDPLMIDSKDDKTEVFISPSSLANVPAADRVVGDGKSLKIDLVRPDNAVVAGLTATVGKNDPISANDLDVEAKVGDTIKAAVGIGAQTRYRDEGIQIQIVTLAKMDASENAGGVTLKAANFSQLQVINAAGDSLRTSWTLAEGSIRAKAVVDGTNRDGGEIKKNALFEPDYVTMRVRARSKDQAGNWSGWNQFNFKGDARKPGIIVLHPAPAGYFSGVHEGVDFEEHLKPLQVRVDEEIESLSVYAKGAYSKAADEDANKEVSIIRLWQDETMDLDLGTIIKEAGEEAVGDTIAYDTRGLKWRNAKGDLKETGQGGTKINLVIEATDKVGNKSTRTVAGVFHDEKVPAITDFFPTNDLLADDNNQINDVTRHPVFTLKEAVDSLSITYDGSGGKDIVHVVEDGLPKGEHQEIIADPFVHDRTYTLTIFARDLAGNAFETPASDAENLRFNEQFENPIANMFKVNFAETETDSVIAGQVNDITIEAFDDKRKALTHKATAMISAWDMASGGQAGSVRFHGKGVTDNGDGSAMLNVAEWKLGKRTVHVVSNKNIGLTKLLVQNLKDGEGGTKVPTFEGAVDSFYVGAADFVGFEVTAWQDGKDVSTRGITGDFDLLVRPVDRYGNASVRAYKGATGKKAEADSLSILDTRIKTAIEYKDGIDVTFASIPPLEELNPLFVFPIEKGGTTFPILLPANRRSLTIQARVDNDNLHEDDMRSQDIRTTKIFSVVAALNPVLTLWVPGSTDDEAGNDVVIPAGGEVTVTVAAEGYEAGSMVTFTKNGQAMDPVAANDDGVAKLMITMSAAGTVKVSATDGDWSADELTITFVEAPAEPMRMAYVDGNGDPVYLISTTDMTVGVDDFLALIAAFGSSEGDDNYNLQADVNDDGMVDVNDFLVFIGSFGKTATGPATKPLVLAPGVNENAEFALSLGSERVVAGELVAVDVSLANVAALVGYGFTLNYETDKFELISVAPADEDLLKSTGGETPLFHHIAGDGQVEVVNGMVNGSAVSGGGDIVRFVFRVLREFEDNARFEIANGLVFDSGQLSNPAVVAGVLELQSTPREFALHQNFPNPFNPDTTIKYDLAESADVTLQIYNVLGQVVRTLVASEAQNAGRYQIRWNGMDDRGVPVSSGIYFYQIAADGKFSDVRKLMLLK